MPDAQLDSCLPLLQDLIQSRARMSIAAARRVACNARASEAQQEEEDGDASS